MRAGCPSPLHDGLRVTIQRIKGLEFSSGPSIEQAACVGSVKDCSIEGVFLPQMRAPAEHNSEEKSDVNGSGSDGAVTEASDGFTGCAVFESRSLLKSGKVSSVTGTNTVLDDTHFSAPGAARSAPFSIRC